MRFAWIPNQCTQSGAPAKSKKVFTCASKPRTWPFGELIGAFTRIGNPSSVPSVNDDGVTNPFELMVERCERRETRRREIIFQARIVIGRLEVLEVRVAAARAGFAKRVRRIAGRVGRPSDADRRVEVAELRPRPGLRPCEPQHQLAIELDLRVDVGKPVGFLVVVLDRRERESRARVVSLGSVQCAIDVDSAKADLAVDGCIPAQWESPIGLQISCERLFVRGIARGRIIGRRSRGIASKRPERLQIVLDALVGRRRPGDCAGQRVGTLKARTEQFVVERHVADRRAVIMLAVAAAVLPASVAVDVANTPQQLRQEWAGELIGEVEAALPVLALRLLVFFEQSAIKIIGGIGVIEIRGD